MAGVYDEAFAVHLVVSADEDYTRDLITLGDPINAAIWTSEEECGFHDGGIVVVVGVYVCVFVSVCVLLSLPCCPVLKCENRRECWHTARSDDIPT